MVTATDNIKGYWPKGMTNWHYHVIQDDIVNTHLARQFDFITCISVLEHIERHQEAVASMFSLLAPGGHLLLTFPYNEQIYVPNVYQLEGAGYGSDFPFIGQVFSRREIDGWLSASNGEIAAQEYWQVFSGELWTFGERLTPPIEVTCVDKHQLSCVLLRNRT